MELAEKIYMDLGHVLPNNIKKYKIELSEIDYTSFLAFNIKKYDKNYCEGLFLSIPELWADFYPENWLQLSLSLNPRPNTEIINDLRYLDMGGFYDLLFMANFLEINFVSFLINNDLISDQEKFKILHYSRCNFELFFVSKKVIIEDLEDFYIVDYKFFQEISAKLCKVGMPKMLDDKVVFLKFIEFELSKIK